MKRLLNISAWLLLSYIPFKSDNSFLKLMTSERRLDSPPMTKILLKILQVQSLRQLIQFLINYKTSALTVRDPSLFKLKLAINILSANTHTH